MSPARLLAIGAALAAVIVALFVPIPESRAVVVGSPHDFTSSNSLYASAPFANSGVCSICHIPHDARAGALWPRDLSGYDNVLLMNGGGGSSSDVANYVRIVTIQCYDCHDFHAPQGGSPIVNPPDTPAFGSFATNHKPQDIAFGFTKGGAGTDSGSTMKEDAPAGSKAGYYENYPPYDNSPQTYYGADSRATPGYYKRNNLANDNLHLGQSGGHYFKTADPNSTKGIFKGDKLPCNDCHDPHAWDNTSPGWQAFFRPAKLYGYPSRNARWTLIFGSGKPAGSSYMANPVFSGNTRSDSESRKTCILCHGDSLTNDSVTFNDINSDYSSTAKIVRPPATISEHAAASTAACVSCHEHNSIGANCSQCHGFPPSDTATVRYPSTASSRFVPAPDPDATPGMRGSHPRHYGAKDGQVRNSVPGEIYQFDCNTCHYGSALGVDSSLAHHQNSLVSVVLDGKWTRSPNGPGGAYDNTNYFNQSYPGGPSGQLDNLTHSGGWGGLDQIAGTQRVGWNTCRNVYCHSSGRVKSVMTDADYDNVVWNSGPRRCNGCHGRTTPDNVLQTGMPDYPNGGPGLSANSHNAHVVKNGYGCGVCHAGTASDTGYATGRSILDTRPNPSLHVNNVRNVQMTGVGPSAAYDNNTKQCSNVTCHPSTVTWGASLSCASCHLGAGDVDDFGTGTPASMDNNGITARIDNTEWMWSGHGADNVSKPGGLYDVSGNPVARLGGGNPCSYCHDPNVTHDNNANPFRLANNNWSSLDWNGNCMICHKKGAAAGYAPPPDNTGSYPNVIASSASQVDNNHFNPGNTTNARHTSTYNGGKFCWDCHDPHGDRSSSGGNIFMIGKRVTRASDNVFGLPVGGNDNTRRPLTVFTNNAGGADYASTDNAAPYDGICEVCHESASGILHYVNTGRLDATHFTTKCTVCHAHDAGFRGLGGPDVGQYFDRSIQAPGPSNFADNSSHPLNGLTNGVSTLRFAGTANCLGCHYASGPARTSDECLMCHYENIDGSQGRHMNKVIELTAITGNVLPTSQFTINTIVDYDNWCLQCHGGTTITLGGVAPSGKTVIDPAAFANGRHRARTQGCIYCHQPHGRTNTRLVRENPDNRRTRGVGPFIFGVYPNDNTGSYGPIPNQSINYRSRVDANFADAADENNFCNVACHVARLDNTYMKDKIIRRDGVTGNYLLNPGNNKKVYLINGVAYTNDNTTTTQHGHPNGEIITTDDMVTYIKTVSGLSGPSKYNYPASGNANPNTFNNATSPLPFFPDSVDGSRDFTNAYDNTGWLLKYRYTCSTCHNPHGTTLPNTSGTDGYPDLRERRANPTVLCYECHH